MNYKSMSIAAFGCVAVLGGMFAQRAIAQQSRSDTGQLEEIVVTAEKRESTIETTAISLTAVSGGDIQDRGFTDLADPSCRRSPASRSAPAVLA
jgi:iron complex outermembrane receptor protein